MRINKKRLQALVSWSTLIGLLTFLAIEGGGYLFSEYKKDRYRLSEIKKIESKSGKTVGQLGKELRDYCQDMATTKANERVASMVAQSEKLEKALGYKSSIPRSYDREREEIENSTFNRCLNLSDVNGVGYYYYEVSEDIFRSKINSKWIKLSISSFFSLLMAACLAWVAGNLVVKTIPFLVGGFFNCLRRFISWITAPEK